MVLQTLRQRLSLLLLTALPLHALLVTVATKMISGPGNAPIAYLALWKEALLGVILVVAVVEVIASVRRDAPWRVFTDVDAIDVLIICLVILSFVVSGVIHYPLSTIHFIYGVKYDLIPLIAFLILRRVEWSQSFKHQLMHVLIVVGGIVSLYGIATLFAPQSFFSALGYSDLHSLYNPNGSLAAYQQIGGSSLRRMQSTMSGPNQLGLWLLVPFTLLLTKGVQRNAIRYSLFVISLAILFTFSRSAWIAAALMIAVVAWQKLPRKKFLLIAHCSLLILVIAFFAFPNVLRRSASTRDHLVRPIEAVNVIAENPLGLGLGTAGPASNRISNTCVHLEEGADPSWAQDRPELCVFVGETQVQPEAPCNCPLLPENWYLQMGVELGIIGFILYLALIIFILTKLRITSHESRVTGLIFLGLAVASLFLHAWEDAAVAYTVWVMVAVALSTQAPRSQTDH